jgi:hypothetical protein
MNVVEASGLGKRYGGTWALAGEVAGLLAARGQASLEDLALAYLRETRTSEMTR